MNANSSNQCPQCGQAIAAGLKGLCPNCLALVGFGGSPAPDNTLVVKAGDQPGAAAQVPLSASVNYFGDYELLGEVARGGMGVVYRARQVSLNRIVAVKMIRGGQFATDADVKRFRTEAEAAAKLQHPNIVAIHEVGDHQGRHYFSMDLVEGPTLAEIVRNGPLSTGRAAQLVKNISEAVEFAHRQGVLHRDLKPSNVLVDCDDRPRITDFGLAKIMHGDSSLTNTGDVMGSPSYMAPEQARGQQDRIGPATDVYSLGAVLYYLLTGRAPFEGATVVDTLRQLLDEEPARPSRLNAKVPSDLETICLKCLQKEPGQRYASARELAEELGRFLNYEPILAKPASGLRRTWNWSQKNPWVFVGVFASLVLAMACVAYGFWERLRYLDWRLETKMEPEHAVENSPALFFLVSLPLIMLLVYISCRAFRRFYQQRTLGSATPPAAHLLAHAAFGLLGILAGMVLLFLQIRCWAWKMSEPWMLALEISGVACALVLSWIGFQMVWEAVGVHETSRFRSLVDKSLEMELKNEAHRWSLWKLMGLPVWLLMVAATCAGLLSCYIKYGRIGLAAGIAGLLMGIATAGMVWRCLHRRRRLFTHIFAPLAVKLFVLVLAGLGFGPEAILSFIILTPISLLLAILGKPFFGGANTASPTERRPFPGKPWLDALGGVAVFVGLMVAFHLVENWRGAREWARVKAELTAQGENLDFDSYLKPRVPDEQNVMKHPFMTNYFVKGGKSLNMTPPPYDKPFNIFPYQLSDLKTLPRQPDPAKSLPTLTRGQGSREILPAITFSNQPLGEAFLYFANRSGLKFDLATNELPWVGIRKSRTGEVRTARLISSNYTNVTAIQGMERLSRSFNLTPNLELWREAGVLQMEKNTRPTLQSILTWYTVNKRRNLAQLEEALQQPYSQLAPDRIRPWSSPVPNFVSFRSAAQALVSRSKVHLLMGNADAALKDMQTVRRLTDSVQANNPPTLMEAMIKVSFAGLLTSTLEETLADGLWPATHLERIQKVCEGVDLLSGYALAMRGERAGVLRIVETGFKEDKAKFILEPFRPWDGKDHSFPGQHLLLRLSVPDGWFDQNKANLARVMQHACLGVDPVRQRVNTQALRNGSAGYEELERRVFRPYVWLTGLTVPNISKSGFTVAKNQTLVNQAFIACALERHRAAKGNYPERLDALVPEFAAKLPHDIIDGQPLRYRRTDDGKYLLYSIGWNNKDDSGITGEDFNTTSLEKRGDWVWQGVPKSK
jgi:hypothetical protein